MTNCDPIHHYKTPFSMFSMFSMLSFFNVSLNQYFLLCKGNSVNYDNLLSIYFVTFQLDLI